MLDRVTLSPCRMANRPKRRGLAAPHGAGVTEANTSQDSLAFGGHQLPFPLYFASVSSVKANFSIAEYLALLCGLRAEAILVSAWDIHHADSERATILDLMERARDQGSCMLLDSGNYESYWHEDRAWTPDRYA